MQENDATQSLDRLADFLFEAGMLRHIARSGYAYLGSGSENVAEHSYRTAIIGFVLGRMADADAAKVALLCLFHDLHEARTGDFNYVQYRYNCAKEEDALKDALKGTGLSEEVMNLYREFTGRKSVEARLAKDADQLDLICNLRVELEKGNQQARAWIDSALPRLRTPEGKKLAHAVLRADPSRWWRNEVEESWWINHGSDDV